MATFTFLTNCGRWRRGQTVVDKISRQTANMLAAKLGIPRSQLGFFDSEGPPRPVPELTPPPAPEPPPLADTKRIEQLRAELDQGETALAKAAEAMRIAEDDLAAILLEVDEDEKTAGLRGCEPDPRLRRRLRLRRERRAERQRAHAEAQAALELVRDQLAELDQVGHRHRLQQLGSEVRWRLQQLGRDPELLELLAGDERWFGRARIVWDEEVEAYVRETAAKVEEFAHLLGEDLPARLALRRVPELNNLFEQLLAKNEVFTADAAEPVEVVEEAEQVATA